MKLNLKKYLLSLMALVCLIAFSGCADSALQSADSNQNAVTTTANETSSANDSSQSTATITESTNITQTENATTTAANATSSADNSGTATLDFNASYTSKNDVALYIYTYGCLPSNFISKNQARELGWQGGSLEPFAPGKCIGGDYFGNYEGLLPESNGRKYTECDIDTLGASSRGAKRIVFSNDGLIYYTEDHYESFVLLYGEE